MGWALRRIGVSLLLVWIVASIVFVAIRLVPGDPAELLLQQGGAAPDPAIVAQLHDQLGLDRPFLERSGQFIPTSRPVRSGEQPGRSTHRWLARSCSGCRERWS